MHTDMTAEDLRSKLALLGDSEPVRIPPGVVQVWEIDADGCPGAWPHTPLVNSRDLACDLAVATFLDEFLDPEEIDAPCTLEWRGDDLYRDGEEAGVCVRRVQVYDTFTGAREAQR
ncbi:hypothetical protein [Streptomyces sp. SM12]|uniref:hypothetical protein n=1 Tax=Streptomyces sp. SM12 TaxID=1071602 RepID=UPI000CD5AD9B|nr:hypothetical protein [Streptomyces sp. SM12]